MNFDIDDDTESLNRISFYDTDQIMVNKEVYKKNLIVFPDKIFNNWRPNDITELRLDDLEIIIAQKPELIVLGTGRTLLFPSASIIANVQKLNIGLEVMDIGAACRSYNVLLAEKRHIAAALFIAYP